VEDGLVAAALECRELKCRGASADGYGRRCSLARGFHQHRPVVDSAPLTVVDAEGDEVVGFLVGGDEELPVGSMAKLLGVFPMVGYSF